MVNMRLAASARRSSTTSSEATMPRNAKNPKNPYADAIDEMDVRGLHIILDYVALKGGASGLRFLSIGKIPGLLEVIHYIHHELSVDHKCENVFDYFQLDEADFAFKTPPPTPRPGVTSLLWSMESATTGGSPWQADDGSPTLDEIQSLDSVQEWAAMHALGTGISPWHDYLSPPQTAAADQNEEPGDVPWSPGQMAAAAAWVIPAAAVIYCAWSMPENLL